MAASERDRADGGPTLSLKRLRARVEQLLWDGPPAPGRARGIVLTAARVLVAVIRDVAGGRLTLHAMSLVYTTLLSLVPLLAVSFSVLKAFDVHYQAAPLLEGFLAPLGPQSAEITRRVLGFVENVRGDVLGALGVALLLYTVVSVLQKVEGAFNEIWHTGGGRRLARRFSDYLSVLIVGPVLVLSAAGLTATLLNHDLTRRVLAIEPLGTVIVAAAGTLPYLLVIIAFAFAYVFLTNTRVRPIPALLGALVAGVLWQTTGWAFGTFVTGSARYAAIYSGFAILLLFMIWLYLSWLILLVGSQVAFYVQHPHLARPDAARWQLGHRARERAGLALMYLVAQRHLAGQGPLPTAEAGRALRLPPEWLAELIDTLSAAGLLMPAAGPVSGLLPARDAGAITVAQVLATLRRGHGDASLVPDAGVVDRVIAELESAVYRALGGRTLRQLVLEDDAPDAAG